MSQFNEAFAEFSKNPTSESLECFATQIEVVSKMIPRDDVKRSLITCMSKILKERQFENVRQDETMLRLYKIMCRVSTQLGGTGIFEQLEKRGHFSDSLKFHLQWAEECAKVKKLKDFETVLEKAVKRLSDKMSLTAIESGFRDIADEYFPDDVKTLFVNPDDTMSLFDTRTVSNASGKRAKRRSSVCFLRQVAPIYDTGKSIFGPKTSTKLRTEFIDSADCYGVSIEEFRYAKWRDDFGEDVDVSEKRRDSGVVKNQYKPNQNDLNHREAVESRLNPKRRQMSTLDEKTIEEHEEEKRTRMFSPVVKTKDAQRPPLRDATLLNEKAPATITISSDTKTDDYSFKSLQEESLNGEDTETLKSMAAGKKENKRPERSLSTSSHYSTSSTRTAKSGVGLELMAENNHLEAHAMFSDTVHLGGEKTLVLGDDTVFVEKPTQVTNQTTDFSVLCDPDPTMHVPADRPKKTSNGLNVVYDEQEEGEVEAPKTVVAEDLLPAKSLTTPPSFEDIEMFDEEPIFDRFARAPRGSMLTSTPAGCIPFVPVEEYFGNKDEEDSRSNDDNKFVAPSTSSLHQMLRRKSQAAASFAAPPLASAPPKAAPAVVNSSIDCLTENLGRRLSIGAEEIRKAIEDEAETTGIQNRRRSEVMRGDINPWDEDLRKKVMGLVRPPTNMHEFAIRSPKIQAMRDFEAGGEKFHIQTLIGQGGYAKVYRAVNEDQKTVAVKYEVPSCSWEVYICDQMRNRLLKDGDEAKRKMADWCIMQVMDAYVFSTASLLVNEYHEHGTLLEMANNYKDPNWHVTCFLLTQMARILKEVHACNIVHGDIKPDNFIITRKIDLNWDKNQLMSPDAYVFKLIDWGRAIDMLPLPGKTFKGRAGTEGFDSPEMIDGRSWTYQADYYGFAATMAVLVTGKYASLKGDSVGNYSLNVDIKRRNILRETVLNVINKFLNIASCDQLPDWDEVINSFTDFWNEKFEVPAWKQAAAKFNEACELATKSRS